MTDVVISSGSSRAEVALHGAHVRRLSLDGEEALKPASDGVQTHGGAAVLIPYAGRVRRGRYAFEGVEYQLPVGRTGHAIHGFAKDSQWDPVERTDDTVRLRARLAGEGYPGVLEAEVAYAIGRTEFSTTCEVKNVGKHDCPLAVGFHPYFLAEEWSISAEGRAHKYLLADGYFPTGQRVACSLAERSPSATLDDPFSVAGTVTLKGRGGSLTILRKRMPYLLIYDGKYAEGKSVAIEPYTALPDAYNNGVGLLRLRPGGEFACGYQVQYSHPPR